MAEIIDGKAVAKRIREEVKTRVEKLKREKNITPKLSVVLIGDNPASLIYVRNKEKAAAEVGIVADTHQLPTSVKENEVLDLISRLNEDRSLHGILIQIPLPEHLNAEKILEALLPEKDVDGLHPLNMGKLLRGAEPLFIPCTPLGVMELVLSTGVEIKGKEAVVVGRSNLVGKPTAILLLQRHATVTLCHTRTKDLGKVVQRGEIVVAATGSPELVKGDMIQKGAMVIDVGSNRVGDKLVGDVEFESAKNRAAYITPVPGGVGPMTIAMLLKNTLLAAERANQM